MDKKYDYMSVSGLLCCGHFCPIDHIGIDDFITFQKLYESFSSPKFGNVTVCTPSSGLLLFRETEKTNVPLLPRNNQNSCNNDISVRDRRCI